MKPENVVAQSFPVGAELPCPSCSFKATAAAGLATHVRRYHPDVYAASVRPPSRGPLPTLALAVDMPLDEALERWRRARVAAPATVTNYACVLRTLALAGIENLSDLTLERFAGYLSHRLQSISDSSANRHWAAVCSILASLERQELFPVEVLARLRRLKPKKKARARLNAPFLLREEVERLRKAARASARPRTELVVMVGVLAGLRAAELARLRWEDVDFSRRAISVRLRPELGEFGRIKTGRERLVPLCDELREVLAPLRRPAGYVFPQECPGKIGVRLPFSQVRVLRKDLARVVKVAGMSGVTFHLLRHTRASWWLQGGTPAVKVAKWLGHSTDVLELHYAGLLDGYDADAERSPGHASHGAEE